MTQPRVAFLGLGRMGAAMVAALADRGISVTVWNRSSEKASSLANEFGLRAAASPAEASRAADVVFTMLTDGTAVLQTLDGEDGVLAGAGAGTVVLDCSTTGAAAAVEAAKLCAAAGVGFLDCPVSGSTLVARQGKLGLMVGGEVSVLDGVRPLLGALGTVVHVGPTGAGAAAKVAVNALLHTFNTALGECLVTARAAGVSSEALFDVLEVGVLWNRFLDYKRPAYTHPETAQVAFNLRTATKDLDLAVTAALAAGLSRSVVAQVHALHTQAVADGFGDRDIAAMAAWIANPPGAAGDPPASGDSSPRRTPERS